MTILAPLRRLGSRRVFSILAGLVTLVLWTVAPATASPSVQFGVQDDAWLLHGPGTLSSRVTALERLGVDIVRVTLRWDEIARRKPTDPRDQLDRRYNWADSDRILRALRRHGLAALVTLVGTPEWANGGQSPNWAPTDPRSFGNFAYAAANRYQWVRAWTIWNEPNQSRWLQPTSASIYVRRLLNPAYAQIHAVIPDAQVGGGMTSPRANRGVSPVAWIRETGRLGGRLDAYAHHPYPSLPKLESPWEGGCEQCSTLSMAALERLLDEVKRSFGPTRIWLTEYGYQTDPPDAILGVSPQIQARYVASAARRVYLAPYVDMLINFMVRDDAETAGWQSGLIKANGIEKPSYTAFRFPLEQVSRTGDRVTLWGQIRPRSGLQPYRLRVYRDGRWSWLGDMRWTDSGGFFTTTVRAKPGSLVQVFSQGDGSYSLQLRIR